MRGLVVLGFAALLGQAAMASEVSSYTIDLKYDPASATVTAKAGIALKPEPAKTITFYLHDELKVTAVRRNGRPLRFRQHAVAYEYNYDTKANQVDVETGGQQTDKLEIDYRGRFTPSAARSPSDYMRGDHDGLYLRSYGYSLWFPVFAPSNAGFPAVDFTAVKITAPADFRAVFVGEEISRTESHGLATAIWQAKAVGPYDAQLTLRRFAVKHIGAVAAYYLKDPASEAAATRILDYAGKLLAYYRNHYRQTAGERPIHMVEEPKFGDIAGANMVGLNETRWRDIKPDGDAIVTLAHELVHAFVQTPTAKSDPLYAFEIEGFPSYFHLPALASLLGQNWYDKRLNDVEQRYLERRATGKSRGETLPVEKPILTITPDEVGTYKDVFVLNDRALLFWDYLRRTMTPESFDALVGELTASPAVTAVDFFALIGKHAPARQADVQRWLTTSDYPPEFRRTK